MKNLTSEDIYIEFGGKPHPEWKGVFVPEAEKLSLCPGAFGNDGLAAFLYFRDVNNLKLKRVEAFKPGGDNRPDWLQIRCKT